MLFKFGVTSAHNHIFLPESFGIYYFFVTLQYRQSYMAGGLMYGKDGFIKKQTPAPFLYLSGTSFKNIIVCFKVLADTGNNRRYETFVPVFFAMCCGICCLFSCG